MEPVLEPGVHDLHAEVGDGSIDRDRVTVKSHGAYARPEIQRENIARAEVIFRKPTHLPACSIFEGAIFIH